MCGIIGYVGKNKVENLLLESLELLEYRGYDSAGIAVVNEETKETFVRKCTGRVSDLMEVCKTDGTEGNCGIGHTRWATHGGVTSVNAHPHQCGKVTLVHNGIVENYKELIDRYEFDMVSETDTEVVAACINRYYDGNPREAIRKAVRRLKGTFALVVMFEDIPGVIYSIRLVSPIIVGCAKEGNLLASDIIAISPHSKKYFVAPELHVTELREDGIVIYDANDNVVEPQYQEIDWDTAQDGKCGYPFYMEKEIMEQPDAIQRTIDPRIVDGLVDFTEDNIPDDLLIDCKRICIIGCGTAMHTGLVAKSLIQSTIGIHVDVQVASEFIYTEPVIEEGTLVMAVSQSGETIDTLEALKHAKSKGAKTLSIVNVRETSIARTSDHVLYTYAGPEIAVASTKAYTTQIAVFYLLVCKMASLRGLMSKQEAREYIEKIQEIPTAVSKILEDKNEIHKVARSIVDAKDAFMIGRGMDYSALLEASLKLKEVAYVHSEAYASGELKHGTIALVTEGTPIIALVTQSKLRLKEMLNIKEVQSRGARIIAFVKEEFLSLEGAGDSDNDFDTCYKLPNLDDAFMLIPASVALQFLAYYTSADRGLDVDKPRNLAKVVTVE